MRCAASTQCSARGHQCHAHTVFPGIDATGFARQKAAGQHGHIFAGVELAGEFDIAHRRLRPQVKACVRHCYRKMTIELLPVPLQTCRGIVAGWL